MISALAGASIWAILLIGLILAVSLVLVAFLVLRGALKKPAATGLAIAERRPVQSSSASVDASFRSALSRLGNRITSGSFRYRLPWVLLIGPPNSGKKTLIDFLPNENPYGADPPNPDGILWGFMRRGVLIKVPGSIFGDSHGDQTGDQQSASRARPHGDLWDQVLRQLTRRRPSRPLDAVVLTIGADELLDASTDIAVRAAQIREKLNRLESGIGMVLPVYVLVTRCDSVQGFGAYCQELEARDPVLKQEIFGWSNDYPIESLFRRVWIYGAMNEIGATLRRQQLETFGERRNMDTAGELYLFPPALDALREPLRILVEKMFAPDSYSDSHYFRGLYFCGDPHAHDQGMGDVGSPLLPVRYSATRQLAFVWHLFDSKIFAEAQIARPVHQRFSHRNRWVAASQVFMVAFSVVMAIGLAFEWRRLSAESSRLSPLIAGLKPALDAAREVPQLRVLKNSTRISANSPAPPAAVPAAESIAHLGDTCPPAKETYRESGPDQELVVRVLEELAYLHTRAFNSWFMPASHVRKIDDRVNEALTDGFGKVVLKAFEHGLHSKYVLLSPLAGTDELPSCSGYFSPAEPREASMLSLVGVNLRPGDDQRHEQLDCYLSQLASLEKNTALYDRLRLRQAGNIVDVRHILEYLSGKTLPGDELYMGNPFFEHAVQNARGNPIEDVEAHRCRAVGQAKSMLTSFYEGWFGASPLAARMAALNAALLEIERGQPKSGTDVRTIGQSIAELDLLFPSDAVDWIEHPFSRHAIPVLARMDDPVFREVFTEDARDGFETQGRAAWMDLRSRLLKSSTPLGGPVLEVDSDSEIRVSGAVRTLGTNLLYLASLDFMASGGTATPSPSTKTPIVWNPDLLGEALKLNTSWEKYQHDVLPSVPGALREGIRAIARRGLGDSMAEIVSRARSPLPNGSASQDVLTTELKNFSGSLEQLKQIYAVSQGLGDSGRSLQASLNLYLQAIRLLQGINAGISPDALYSFQKDAMGKWNGTTPLSQALYVAESPGDLADAITADHNRLQTLVAEADPLVRLLADSGLPAGVGKASVYWENLGTDFRQYADKKPGNPIAALEGFLKTDIDKIVPENRCQAGAADSRAADPFVEALNGLRSDTVRSCLMLVRQRYSALADNFNTHLAGKFPFSANPGAAEARTNDVAAFFDLYSQTSPGLPESLDRLSTLDPTTKPRLQDAIAFLRAMALAQALFATADRNSLPALDVTTQFRSNLNRETGGNQIIDWELRVGSKVIHYPGSPQTLRWQYGDRVTLTVRYAKDSPNKPLAKEAGSGVQIVDRTATWDYRQNWALFALLLSHPAMTTDFDNPLAAVPNTIRLTFANTPAAPRPAGQTPLQDTLIFATFGVQAPGAKDAPPKDGAKGTLVISALPGVAPVIQ